MAAVVAGCKSLGRHRVGHFFLHKQERNGPPGGKGKKFGTHTVRETQGAGLLVATQVIS